MARGRRRHISRDVKNVVVRMDSEGVSRSDIRRFTGVAESTQNRILALYRRTGDVEVIPEERGRKRSIKDSDMEFLKGCIERRPTVTLKELQQGLLETCGISTVLSTIQRALHRYGYVWKKKEWQRSLPRDRQRKELELNDDESRGTVSKDA